MNKFNKLYNLLFESPTKYYGEQYKDYDIHNKYYYNFAINFEYAKQINFNNKVLNIFLEIKDNIYRYYIVDKNKEEFVGIFVLTRLNENNFEFGSVWSSEKGLMTYLFFSYILNLTWKSIRCDGLRTEIGKKWFNKMLIEILKDKRFNCFVIDTEDKSVKIKINSIEEADKYYDKNYFKAYKYRILIEKL